MIEAYATNVAVTGNTVIAFPTVTTETRTTTLSSDSTKVLFNTPGVYKVSVTSNILLTGAGTITMVLLINGVASAKATAQATLDASSVGNLAFTTLIPVVRAPSGNVANVSVQYLGTTATIELVDIVVTKEA